MQDHLGTDGAQNVDGQHEGECENGERGLGEGLQEGGFLLAGVYFHRQRGAARRRQKDKSIYRGRSNDTEAEDRRGERS